MRGPFFISTAQPDLCFTGHTRHARGPDKISTSDQRNTARADVSSTLALGGYPDRQARLAELQLEIRPDQERTRVTGGPLPPAPGVGRPKFQDARRRPEKS